jgi:hypothetical protein
MESGTPDAPLPADKPENPARYTGRLLRSWFELTADEQRIVAAILFLFLLGLAVRVWHTHRQTDPSPPASAAQRLRPATP